MAGTMFRFVSAATNRRTRSHLPRTRRRSGTDCDDSCALKSKLHNSCSTRRRDHALLLRMSQSGSYLFERGDMPIYICLCVGHGNSPLLVPPERLREDSAIIHGEPVLFPKVNVDGRPVPIVPHLLGIEHKCAVCSCANAVAHEPSLLNDAVVSSDKPVIHASHMLVSRRRQHFAKSRYSSSHRKRIRVVSAGVKDFVLRDDIHEFLARGKCRQRKPSANGFCEANDIG